MGEGKPAKSADNSERITTGDTISDSGSTNDVAEQAASALRDEVNNPAGSELVANEGSDTDTEVLDAGSDASLSLLEDVQETETVKAKQKDLQAVQPGLDNLLSRLPVPDSQRGPVDVEQVKTKVSEGKYSELTIPELRKAVELEAKDTDFAKMSGFKATEFANQRLNSEINRSVISANVLLSVYQLRQRPGNPIGLSTIATNAENPSEGYAQRPETFDVLSSNGQIDQAKVQELIKSGKLTNGLNLEPKGIPTAKEITNMRNSMEFLALNQGRIVEAHQRMEAHGKFQVLSKTLGIDKPGWSPPTDTSDLSAYNARSGEAINLVFSVRNYAEAIQTLDNLGGDFKTDALKDFPGKITWGGENGNTITGMDLDLPDSLEQSPENERKFQKLRDWIDKYGGPVDQAMKDFEKGNFIRYGDIIAEGKIELDADGDPIRIRNGDEAQTTLTLVNKDGKVFNLSRKGEMLDSDGNTPKDGELDNLNPKRSSEQFDYINQKFDVKTLPNGDIQVTNNRHFYGDHLLNYQHWFGDHHGSVNETRTYKPDDYVSVQTQTGKVELVRADRLQEWKGVQAFFHHGGKIASTALDVGMVAAGGMGAAGFVLKGAGTGLGFAANVGRVALGAGGLLDPTFRQMGETGEVLRHARHYAILLDVTQGLARQGLGAMSGGRLAFYGKGAQEVGKFIESSATLSKVDRATRYAFGAADGVWIPLIGQGIRDKYESYKPDSVDRAHQQYGSGGENVKDTDFADRTPNREVDPVKAAETTFDIYKDTITGAGEAETRFDRAMELLRSGDQAKLDSERNDNLIKLFEPSGDQLQAWRKSNGHKSVNRVKPGDIENPEDPASSKEKVAAAISLLFLAQKDGKLPEDGVLASREVTVPGYKYQDVVASPHGASTVTRSVEAESIEQKVTVDDVVETLERATLDSSDPGTQLVAADALYRTGSISTAKYASVVLDVLENNSTDDGNREIKMKALRQLSDLNDIKRLEENNPGLSGMSSTEYKADSYGFSHAEISEKLSNYIKSESDPDVRAMGTAVLLAQDNPERSKVISDYHSNWQSLKDSPGQFHKNFIQQLNQDIEKPLPSDGDVKTFDQARLTKLRAALALGHLDGANGEGDYSDKVNKALLDTINFKGNDADWYKWDSDTRPDIGITMHAFNELVPRINELDSSGQKQLRQVAIDVVRIEPTEVNPRATDETRQSQSENLRQTAQARLLVIGQAKELFGDANESVLVKAQARKFEAALANDLTDESIQTGWGQLPEMRVGAIKGLTNLGTLENKSLGLILNRLNFDQSKTSSDSFYEGVPHVRSAALESIRMLGREDVLRNPEKYSMPEHFTVNEMLKRERDNATAAELWGIWERGNVRQDPESIEAVYDYQKDVKRMQSAVNTDGTIDDLMALAKQNPSKFGRLNQSEDDLEKIARDRAEDTWSWFGSEFAYWITGNHEAEETKVYNKERPKLLAEREQHFENLYDNFSKMTDAEQETTLKTFLHVIEGGEPKLFDNDHQAANVVDSAKYIEGLARRSSSNDIVKDKDMLGRVVVSALLNNKKLDPRAKEHLLGALDHLTAKPGELGFNSGNKSDDYSVISPTEAGAIYTQVLSDEGARGAPNEDTPNWKKDASKRVQLEAINKIHSLRYHGSYSQLAALGPDTRIDATNPGSPYPEVRQRAREVHDSLLNGVGWIYNDSVESKTASHGKRAQEIDAGLMNGDTNNYEEAVKSIFRSMAGLPISNESDPRRDSLKAGMKHPSSRVKLASSWMLSQSAVDSDFKDATKVLADLAVNATEAAIQKEASGLLRAMIEDGGEDHQEIARAAWQNAFDQRKDSNHPAEKPPGEISNLERTRAWYRHATPGEKGLVASMPLEQKKALVMELTGMTEAQLEASLVPPPVMDRRSLDFGFGGRGLFANHTLGRQGNDPLFLLKGGLNELRYTSPDFRPHRFNQYQPINLDRIRSTSDATDLKIIDPSGSKDSVLPKVALGQDGRFQIVLDANDEFTLDSGTKVSINPDNTFSFEPPSQLGSVEDFQEFIKFMQVTNPEFAGQNNQELANQYLRYLQRAKSRPVIIDTNLGNSRHNYEVIRSDRFRSNVAPVINFGRGDSVDSQIASWVNMKQARIANRQQRIDSMLNHALNGGTRSRVELERPVWKPASKVAFSKPSWLPSEATPIQINTALPYRIILDR